MEVSCSSHSLLFYPQHYGSRKFTKTLQFERNIDYSSLRWNVNLVSEFKLGFRTVPPIRISGRPFRVSLRVSESEEIADRRDEAQIYGVDQKYPKNLKALTVLYKEAILDGDDDTLSELDSIICRMEEEKDKLLKKAKELKEDVISVKEKVLHQKADFENYRKRSEKDRLTLTSEVRGDVIESLLALVDTFEATKQQVKPETEKQRKINSSYQGIYKQFVEVMRNLGVAAIGTVGKPFDPSLHEAIGREESREFRSGVITKELSRGFVLGDRVLRRAQVKVSSGRGINSISETTEKDEASAKDESFHSSQ